MKITSIGGLATEVSTMLSRSSLQDGESSSAQNQTVLSPLRWSQQQRDTKEIHGAFEKAPCARPIAYCLSNLRIGRPGISLKTPARLLTKTRRTGGGTTTSPDQTLA